MGWNYELRELRITRFDPDRLKYPEFNRNS